LLETTKIKLKKPELLAPAGNLEKLQFAIRYGADAVYIGGESFGLRAKAGNFNFHDMEKGVDFAKQFGAKVYVVTNIIAHNADLTGFKDYVRTLTRIGIDALIIADPAFIALTKQAVPEMEIHLSTQASTTNWLATRYWQEEGVKRIVLAREVSLKEIKEIKNHLDIELEAFIHGAMCVSYSGRCVLSNHMALRDANRGGCAQSCRWHYDLYSAGDRLISPEDDPFTMGSKDLAMIQYLPEVIAAGVDSLKIEGRMKSIHYVATVINAYRQAIDAYYNDTLNDKFRENWLSELRKASHRPTTTAFYFHKPDKEAQIYKSAENVREYDFVGMVLAYDPLKQEATIQQRNHFAVNDEVEFFGPTTNFKQVIRSIIDGETGENILAAPHPLQIVKIPLEYEVQPFDMMRKEN